jgi:hypothetical protein
LIYFKLVVQSSIGFENLQKNWFEEDLNNTFKLQKCIFKQTVKALQMDIVKGWIIFEKQGIFNLNFIPIFIFIFLGKISKIKLPP